MQWLIFLIIPITYLPFFESSSWDQRWFLVYASALLVSVLLLSKRHLTLPRLNSTQITIFIFLALYYIASLILNPIGSSHFRIADKLSFVILFIYLLQIDLANRSQVLRHISLPSLIALIIVCSYSYYHLLAGSYTYKDFPSLFENKNMLAQAIALLMILILPLLFSTKNLVKIGLIIVFLFATVLIFYSGCRSVILILFISVFTTAYFLSPSRLSKKALGFAGLFLCLSLFVLFAIPHETHSFFQLNSSNNSRLKIVLATLDLIKEHPLGVGEGVFKYASLPYLYNVKGKLIESYVFNSPHNEFLRILAENGIVFSLGLFLLFFTVVKSYYQKIGSLTIEKKLLFLLLSLFFTVEMLVQFPLENPFPFIGFIIFSAFLMDVKKVEKNVKLQTFNVISIVFMFVFLNLKVLYVFPTQIFPSLQLSKMLCTHSLDFWPQCRRVSEHYKLEKNLPEAETILLKGLKLQPYNYLLFKEWIWLQPRNRQSQFCKASRIYNNMFSNSSVHGGDMCGNNIPTDRNAMKTYKDFVDPIIRP